MYESGSIQSPSLEGGAGGMVKCDIVKVLPSLQNGWPSPERSPRRFAVQRGRLPLSPPQCDKRALKKVAF